MIFVRKLILSILVITTLVGYKAYANEQEAVKQLIHNFYTEDVKALLCTDPNGDLNKQLVVVSERYLTTDFMKYYRTVCEGYAADWRGDPRTGELGSFNYEYLKAGFTNLKIEHPKIKGNHASIRTTYDLPLGTYEEYGNFSLFTLIKENGQWKIDDIELGGHDLDKYNKRDPYELPTIKSLKQYIKKGIAEHEAEKKAAVKK